MAARSAGARSPLVEVPLPSRSRVLLTGDIGADAAARLAEAQERGRELLAGRTVWNVNSTAGGGGVAELLRTTLPYWRGAGILSRWLVVRGTPAFFRLTKRLHNMLHGDTENGRLGPRDASFFARISGAAGAAAPVRPGDIAILHDPQTAGLVPILKRAGAVVVWRCHIGADAITEPVEEGWRFLLPKVAEADMCVFTRRQFVPPGLDPHRTAVFPPAIDPCSPKNQWLAPRKAKAIVAHCDLARGLYTGLPREERDVGLRWGGRIRVTRRCQVLSEPGGRRPGPERLVVALSRWDRLKDPIGIMHAFAEHVDDPHARLIVAGPAAVTVVDDPEGPAYLRAARAEWEGLARPQRRRIELAAFPMVDLDENALIVNALQRQASVLVKKSLQEGFGLGVTEALWKGRPVVATRVGGQQDQIRHRHTGLLVDDPADLAAFGAAVNELLADTRKDVEFGAAGREDVRARYLADTHFIRWIEALERTLRETGLTAGRIRI